MMQHEIMYREVHTPVGQLVLLATEEGICYVQFGAFEAHEQELRHWLQKHFGTYELKPEAGREHEHGHERQAEHHVLARAQLQLEQYFAGERKRFELPLDLRGTAFQKSVWNELTRIEYGSTKSYKEVAEALQHPRAVRAIGMANNRNPLSIIVPCHRVIGHDGQLVGYGGGLGIKEKLLTLEQAPIIML